MKAIDPTILIGVNGHVEKDYISPADTASGPIWWQYLLEHAAAQIDFLAVHPYPCFKWRSYDYYRKNSPIFTDAADQAVMALQTWAPPAEAARIRILATETNAFDWAATDFFPESQAGWPWRNDLGHALVLFDILGQYLAHPGIDGVLVWNTRWFGTSNALENVLDDQNALLPTGQVLSLWGQHLQTNLLAVPDQEAGPAYVTYTPETQALTVFLVNKQLNAQPAKIELCNYALRWRATGIVFSGRGPEDEHPTLSPCGVWNAPESVLCLELPPVSIFMINFEPAV